MSSCYTGGGKREALLRGIEKRAADAAMPCKLLSRNASLTQFEGFELEKQWCMYAHCRIDHSHFEGAAPLIPPPFLLVFVCLIKNGGIEIRLTGLGWRRIRQSGNCSIEGCEPTPFCSLPSREWLRVCPMGGNTRWARELHGPPVKHNLHWINPISLFCIR